MTELDRTALKLFARKYVWWKTPDEAIAMPERGGVQKAPRGCGEAAEVSYGEFAVAPCFRLAITRFDTSCTSAPTKNTIPT
jgi:hypothetical protein